MLLRLSALPIWYLVVVAYTAILGIFALRNQASVAATLKDQERITADPRDPASAA